MTVSICGLGPFRSRGDQQVRRTPKEDVQAVFRLEAESEPQIFAERVVRDLLFGSQLLESGKALR